MSRFATRITIAAIATALAAGFVGIPNPATGSDHLDAPGLTSPGGSGQFDVNDLYAFQSPDNPDNAVIIGTYNPLAGMVSPEDLDPSAVYGFEIDTDGDAVADNSISALFGPPDSDGSQAMILAGTDGSRLLPTVHAVAADSAEGATFAGSGWVGSDVYDDPFFFDLNGFTGDEGRAFCDGGEFDFFAGANVTGIVIEIPRSVLGADSVGVWATVRSGGEQIDRVGRPAINTVFIEGDAKNDYNAASPANDAADYSDALGDLAGTLLPDVLTVDFSVTDGFLNGRLPADDVIDIELQVISDDESAGDCVDGNDAEFSTSSPYLAAPHTEG